MTISVGFRWLAMSEAHHSNGAEKGESIRHFRKCYIQTKKMSHRKRFIRWQVALLAILLLLSGCQKGTGGSQDTETQQPEDISPEDLLLVGGNTGDYVIIVPTYATKTESQAAEDLKAKIQEATGTALAVKKDYVREGTEFVVSDREILIGSTNRTESITAKATVPYQGDYYVGVQGSKLIVLANTESGYDQALNYLADCFTAAAGLLGVQKTLEYSSFSHRDETLAEKSLDPVLHWGFEEVENSIALDDSGSHPAVLKNMESKWGYVGEGVMVTQLNPGYADLGKGTIAKALEGKSSFSVSFAMMRNYRCCNLTTLLKVYFDGSDANLIVSAKENGVITVSVRSVAAEPYKTFTYSYSVGGNESLPTMSSLPLENTGVWQTVTISVDLAGRSVAFFANGKQIKANESTSMLYFSSNTVKLGNCDVSDSFGGPQDSTYYCFSGFLDELSVYDHALNAEEVQLLTPVDGDTTSPAKDQKFVEQLVSRMGDSAAIYEDSGNVLYHGKIDKLDVTDYSQIAKLIDGVLCIPANFVVRWIGDLNGVEMIEAGGCNYYSVDALCSAKDLTACRYGKLTVLSKSTDQAFSVEDDARYLERMIEFYTDSWYPSEPKYPYEQTRVVVEKSGTNLGSYTTKYLCTPSITEHKGKLYLSTDLEGINNRSCEIYLSEDDGDTWSHISSVPAMYWATLFSHDGSLYLLGVSNTSATARQVTIVKSEDDGKTWTTPRSDYGILAPQYTGAHSGGMPILCANGKIYKTFEDIDSLYRNYPFMMWIDEDADLLDPNAWNVTEKYDLNDSLYLQIVPDVRIPNDSVEPLEGNAVLTPDGRVVNMLRLTTATSPGYGLMLVLDENTKTLSAANLDGLKNGLFFSMPTGTDKFTIKYDEQTGYYIAFVNNKTQSLNYWSRNVLSMVISKDLVNWSIVDTILTDRTMMNPYVSLWKHGFQYVDWMVDGEDLVLAVREAMDDSANFHDSNYICTYRIKNYQAIISEYVDR